MCKDVERTGSDSVSAAGPFKCTGLLTLTFMLCCCVIVSSQVMSLSPAPLSLLIKAAPILTDDMYGDVQPAAWELLLSVDEHMAAAAGEFLAVRLVCSDPCVLCHGLRFITQCSASAPSKQLLMLCKTF